MVHRGEIVEAVVRRSGVPLTRLADQLGVTRKTIYNKFEERNLEYDFILKIGKVLRYDFKDDFPEFFSTLTPVHTSRADEPAAGYTPGTLDECERQLFVLQSKYLQLLERYHELLDQKNIKE